MMGATSLPTAQPAMPAGFAAFLANIGQVSPDGGSEGGGFDQLIAAGHDGVVNSPTLRTFLDNYPPREPPPPPPARRMAKRRG